MNKSKVKVKGKAVESILQNTEQLQAVCIEENGVPMKCEPGTIIFQAIDDHFIHTQHGALATAAIPQNSKDGHIVNTYPFPEFVDAGKPYSSTTIVGPGDDTENEMEVTTIHVLGMDEDGNMEVAYDGSLTLPMETMEVPVGTILAENEEGQPVHFGEYTTVIHPTSAAVQEDQQMVLASTDSQGHCYVTVQDDEVIAPIPVSKNNTTPTVAKVFRPNPSKLLLQPGDKRSFMRIGRSRMIADKYPSIPVAEFKAQLKDTSDIIRKLEVAPSTKMKMKFLSTKGKLFSIPGHDMNSPRHLKLFSRHLVAKQTVEKTFDDMELQPLGYQPQVDPSKIKRITRRRRYPEAEEYQRRVLQQQMQQTFDNLVAESQKNMEAVFLENTGTLEEDEDQGNLQILVQAAESDSLEQHEERNNSSGSRQHLKEEEENSYIQVHVQNEGEENLPSNDWLGTVQQFIIIVPSDPLVDTTTETVITS